ncbi:hypothetical protein Tco_1048540, partial [Tanacetum coccineum]
YFVNYVGIKRLLDDLRVTAAQVCVAAAKLNIASVKLVLLVKIEENILSSYYCLCSVNAASGKNVNIGKPKAVVNAVKGNNVNAVKASACWVWKPKTKVLDHGNPQMDLQDQGVIDSGCSRHMTGNMSYLTDYEEIDGGYVAFGGNLKGGKITRKCTIKTGNLDFENVYFVRELKFNLFSVSQMCDKKNSVLFNDTECIVLSPNFKLIDESQVLLRVPRKNNMYSVDLKNIVPKGGLTCLFAKATSDESKLWHRRPGSGPDWLFDIDALTRTMNYEPIVAGTQSNGFADPKSSHDDGFKPSSDDGKKVDEDPRKDSEYKDQEKEDNVNSTNNVNIVISTVNAAGTNEVNVVGGKQALTFHLIQICMLWKMIAYLTSQEMMKIIIHEDYPLDQVIGDLQSATQTRKMSKNLEDHGKNPKRSMIGSIDVSSSLRNLTSCVGVCACARLQVNQKVFIFNVVKRNFLVLLNGQPQNWAFGYPKIALFDLVSNTDSDYAREALDRKSTTEIAIFFRCRLISAVQKRNTTVVANSTTVEMNMWLLQVCCGYVL